MAESPNKLTLASQLGHWSVALTSGDLLRLSAHAFSEVGADYVFVLLMDGEPCFEVEVARIPSALVSEISGG